MASANPDPPEDGSSPHEEDEEYDPDVAKIAGDTENVFRGFIYRRLTSQIDKEGTEGDLQVADIPPNVMNELRAQESNDNDGTNIEQITILGKNLADFGDEIQMRYHDTFLQMMSNMNLSCDQSFAFDSFTRVARRLFEHGINWGRIIALFCFGYEIAVQVIKQGSQGLLKFLRKITRFIVQFVVKEQIASWIIRQGGWVGALTMNDPDTVWLKRGAAVLVILAVSYGVYSYFSTDKS